MNQNIHIRQSHSSDASQLVNLFKAHALHEGHDLLIINQWEALNSGHHPATIFVVEFNDAIVGYMSLLQQYATWDMQHYLYLDCLFLKPSLRGLGLGRKLMSTATDYAETLGLSQVQWQTPVKNIDAIGFYKNIGADYKNKKRFYWAL